ncbi:MAG: hypothetical protein ACTSRG_10755 [Candidatus Helarchaeota archaeon]
MAGHSLFGNMLCYRDIKEECLAVKNKYEYIDIMDKMMKNVQKIYLCPEFKKESQELDTGVRF